MSQRSRELSVKRGILKDLPLWSVVGFSRHVNSPSILSSISNWLPWRPCFFLFRPSLFFNLSFFPLFFFFIFSPPISTGLSVLCSGCIWRLLLLGKSARSPQKARLGLVQVLLCPSSSKPSIWTQDQRRRLTSCVQFLLSAPGSRIWILTGLEIYFVLKRRAKEKWCYMMEKTVNKITRSSYFCFSKMS